MRLLYRFASLDSRLFVLPILVLVFIRNGIGIHGGTKLFFDKQFCAAAQISNFSSSPLVFLMYKISQCNYLIWILINILIFLILSLAILSNTQKLLNRREENFFIFLLSISPLPTILIREFAYYDGIFYIFLYLGIFSRGKYFAFFSGFCVALVHAEASFLIGTLLLLYKKKQFFKSQFRLFHTIIFAKTLLIIGLVLCINSLFRSHGDRFFLMPSLLYDALSNFTSTFPQLIYSFFGAMWLVIALSVQAQNNLNLKAAPFLLAPFFVALVATMITSDGTRIANLILMPFVFIFSRHLSSFYLITLSKFKMALISTSILPAILVQSGSIQPQYAQILKLIRMLI